VKRLQTYRTSEIEVTFDPNRCVHYAACIRALPAVFDSRVIPWVRLEASEPSRIAEAVARCPTGALHSRRLDVVDAAVVPAASEPVTITASRNGPLYLQGDVQVELEDGTKVVHDTRVALCRCGKSALQPLCDGSHRAAGFLAG
jgi:uncharacterized Fe-S cluster protein YjdI